jgi:transcriptional regulator with XRE-family HTH domain
LREKSWRTEPTPLARFVTERLAEIKMRQSEFCRLNRFDQGMLSKIQNSMNTNLSLESALKLAVGLSVRPERILSLIGRADLHELVTTAYTTTFRSERTC